MTLQAPVWGPNGATLDCTCCGCCNCSADNPLPSPLTCTMMIEGGGYSTWTATLLSGGNPCGPWHGSVPDGWTTPGDWPVPGIEMNCDLSCDSGVWTLTIGYPGGNPPVVTAIRCNEFQIDAKMTAVDGALNYTVDFTITG